MRHIRFHILVLYIVLGAVIGSLIGESANFLPEGVVQDFFLRSLPFGFDPVTVNLRIISFTIGFWLTVNIAGIMGIAIAVYILRWYR